LNAVIYTAGSESWERRINPIAASYDRSACALRIISGELRGRKLASIRGKQTRPTADRVREALFNIVGSRLAGAHVLDLFAGTGALGIEALSRGAKMAVFVENAAPALQVIQKNIASCRLESRATIVRLDIARSLSDLAPLRGIFDLIFIDPPYRCDLIRPTLEQLTQGGLLSPEALIVVEHDPLEPVEPPQSLETIDHRRYGQTRLSFLTLAP
jgi:16S rRNA (guanine966-N2)-methyltransferase